MFEKRKSSNLPIIIIAIIMLVSGFYIGKILENKEDSKAINTVNATNNEDDAVVLKKDAKINFKVRYTKCGHKEEKEEKISNELVGFNQKKVEEYAKFKYPKFEITDFDEDGVVLSKKIESYCNDHYELGAEKGIIVIYKYENGERTVVEKTDFSITNLPDTDKEQLEKGIIVESKQKVEEMLEDFVS